MMKSNRMISSPTRLCPELMAHFSDLSTSIAAASSALSRSMRPILQTVSECLLIQEAELKSKIKLDVSSA